MRRRRVVKKSTGCARRWRNSMRGLLNGLKGAEEAINDSGST